MIVDCGGGTVDLTTRKLENENQLSEVTERAGDYCGSSFIEEAFLKHLGKIVGDSTIDTLRDKNSKSLQYMVQHFCRKAKFPFTDENTDFQYELDISDTIKVLKKHINGETKELMKRKNWCRASVQGGFSCRFIEQFSVISRNGGSRALESYPFLIPSSL